MSKRIEGQHHDLVMIDDFDDDTPLTAKEARDIRLHIKDPGREVLVIDSVKFVDGDEALPTLDDLLAAVSSAAVNDLRDVAIEAGRTMQTTASRMEVAFREYAALLNKQVLTEDDRDKVREALAYADACRFPTATAASSGVTWRSREQPHPRKRRTSPKQRKAARKRSRRARRNNR